MGGLGKSTVALAAAQEAQSRGWRVWWVTATDPTSLIGGMLEILRELNAPDEVTGPVSEGAPTAADRAWKFLNGSHLAGWQWLLIFDNADDPAVLAAPGAASPGNHVGWLRPDPRGAVIVTTRHRDPRAWGYGIAVRELQPLDKDAAAKVLADLAPEIRDPDGRQARELGERLGGLPLALHVAGSYLGSEFARWHTFADYHHALDSAELRAILDDLGDSADGPRTDIQRTWGVSLEAVAAGYPQARLLLFLLSCYAPTTRIPVTILRPDVLSGLPATADQRSADAGEDGDAALDRRLRACLRGLVRVGLIDDTTVSDAQTITVHPVVADVYRVWLRRSVADLPRITGVAVRLLRAACREHDQEIPSDWPFWRNLVPHILALLGWAADVLVEATLADLLEVASQAALALVLSGFPGVAENLADAGITAGTGMAADHPARLAIRRALAAAVAEQARNEEAERLYRDLIGDQERVLGHDHAATLAARGEYARALGFLRDPQAEELHRKAIDDQDRVLGPDHRVTLMTRHWLGRLLVRLGQYREAERTYREVFVGRRRSLGVRHPDTLVTRHTLAWAIARQGRYADAEQQFCEVIKDQENTLGDEHPHVLGSGRALAWCITMQNRHEEAERLLRRVLDGQQRIRGDNHPATLETLQTLAYAIGGQGRYSESEDLYRQILRDRPPPYGDDHPATLTTRHMLALCIADQRRNGEALEMLSDTLARRERVLGSRHPETQATRQAIEQLKTSRGPGKARQAPTWSRTFRTWWRRIAGDLMRTARGKP